MSRSVLWGKAVSNTMNAFDIIWAVRTGSEFFTQVADMVADRLSVIEVVSILPDKVCNYLISKYIHGMGYQYRKQVKFFCGQSDFLPLYADQPVFLAKIYIVHIDFCQRLFFREIRTWSGEFFCCICLFENKLLHFFFLFCIQKYEQLFSYLPACF